MRQETDYAAATQGYGQAVYVTGGHTDHVDVGRSDYLDPCRLPVVRALKAESVDGRFYCVNCQVILVEDDTFDLCVHCWEEEQEMICTALFNRFSDSERAWLAA